MCLSGFFRILLTVLLLGAQLSSCSVNTSTAPPAVVEIQPLTEEEQTYLQSRANELLMPLRATSSCKLVVSSLDRGPFIWNTKYVVWVLEETDYCSSEVKKLNDEVRTNELAIGVTSIVELPVGISDPPINRTFDLIHEIDPDNDT